MTRWVLAITATLAISGCTNAGAKPAKQAKPAKPAKAAKPAKPKAVEATAEQKAAVDKFLAAWVKTQTDGDFKAYGALYADPFRGIRRSGTRTVKLDRPGWIKDRGRMFKKKMVVVAERPVLRPTGKQIEVVFKQTWESGNYRDEGFKKMVLTPQGDSFLIAREEMLESRILPTVEVQASGSASLGFASRAGELQLASIEGNNALLALISDDIGKGTLTVEESSFDAAIGGIVGISATRAVDEKKLPKFLAKAKGKKVNVLDSGLGVLCQGNIGTYTVRARGWVDPADDDTAAAEAIWKEGNFIVLADVLAPVDCLKMAHWIRDGSLPNLTPYAGTYDDDKGPIEKAVYADLKVAEDDVNVSVDLAPLFEDEWIVFASVHTPDSCETQEKYVWTMWRATNVGKGTAKDWRLTLLATGEADDQLVDTFDLDGDKAPDVVTSRGVFTKGKYQVWKPDIAVYWPAGLGCDGCEGPECYCGGHPENCGE